jgi:hypothetical protein
MILVDDRPYMQDCPSDRTVRDLAREVCADSPGEGRRMVVAVYCDGQAVAEKNLDAVLSAPLASFGELALQTQPVAALVRTTLEQAIAMLEELSAIRLAAADALDRGEEPAAMQEIRKLLQIWQQVQQSLVFSAEAMGIDLDSLEVEGYHFTNLVSQMKGGLGSLREAMCNHDAVLISDLLRYDLENLFAKWTSFLAMLGSSIQIRQPTA